MRTVTITLDCLGFDADAMLEAVQRDKEGCWIGLARSPAPANAVGWVVDAKRIKGGVEAIARLMDFEQHPDPSMAATINAVDAHPEAWVLRPEGHVERGELEVLGNTEVHEHTPGPQALRVKGFVLERRA